MQIKSLLNLAKHSKKSMKNAWNIASRGEILKNTEIPKKKNAETNEILTAIVFVPVVGQ